MTIIEFLEKWKSESLFGERYFERLSYSLEKGQCLYLLSYKANITVGGIQKKIKKNKYFQTRVQGLTENEEKNIDGDKYVCQQILNQLENEFFKDYNDFIDGEAIKMTK